MKRVFTILATLVFTVSLWAQSPAKMSYQAVIRNSTNQLVVSHQVGMKISILQGTSTGNSVYTEIYNPNPETNANGLVSIEIGGGIPLSGTFASIDWANGPYFIKTETDPTGGTTYSITGTSQLLSVPYALHAKTAETIAGTTLLLIGQDYQGGIIFWLDASGQHGLILSAQDLALIGWNNGINKYIGTKGGGIYAGAMNTAMIVATQMADNVSGEFAAKVCADYTNPTEGYVYGDWYLPSVYELALLSLSKDVIGGLANSYWSSTEESSTQAWYMDFDLGPTTATKNTSKNVRAIRAF